MKAGTYKVKAKGHGSSFMPMEVTLSDDAIQRIQVDASGETSGIADEVFKRLPAKIVPKRLPWPVAMPMSGSNGPSQKQRLRLLRLRNIKPTWW